MLHETAIHLLPEVTMERSDYGTSGAEYVLELLGTGVLTLSFIN